MVSLERSSRLSAVGADHSGTALSFQRSDPSPHATTFVSRVLSFCVMKASFFSAKDRQIIDQTRMILNGPEISTKTVDIFVDKMERARLQAAMLMAQKVLPKIKAKFLSH